MVTRTSKGVRGAPSYLGYYTVLSSGKRDTKNVSFAATVPHTYGVHTGFPNTVQFILAIKLQSIHWPLPAFDSHFFHILTGLIV